MKKKIKVVRSEVVDIIETPSGGFELVSGTEERPVKVNSWHAKEKEIWRGVAVVNIPDDEFYRFAYCGGYVESYEQEEENNG